MKKVRLTRFTKVLLSVCLLATTIYNTPYNIHATEEEILPGEENITEVVETPSEPQAPSESLEQTNTEEGAGEVEVTPEVNETPEVVEPVVTEQPAPQEPEVEPTPEVIPTVTPDEVIPSVEPTVVPSEQPVETTPTEVVPTETPVATQLPEETVVPTELPVETLLPELNEDDRLLSEEEAMLFDLNSSKAKVYPEYLTAKEAGSGNHTAPHDMDGHGGHINLVKTENGYKCLGDSTWGDDQPRNKHYVVIAPSDGIGSNISYVRCDVYGGEKPNVKYFEVIFKNESNGDSVNQSVQEGFTPEMSVVPESWGTSGYWTIEGKTEHLTTDQVDSYAIKDKTTFIWHKTETPIEKFRISFTVDNAQHGSLEGQSEFKDIAQGTPWTEAGIEVPNPIPAEGHKFDGWYEGETKTENFPDTVDGNHTYVAKFTELAMKELSYRVQYFKNDKFDSEKTVVTNDVLENDPDTIIVDKTQINITDKYDGYAFDKVMTGEIPSTIQNGGVIKVYYVTDVEGGEKPGEGDGTPDKYQVKVTYDVVNGRWNDDSADTKYEYVTLYKDGNMAEDGEGTLSSVPAVGDKPATGFKAGEWNAKTSQVITKEGNKTFTYEYAEADLQDVYVYAQITGKIPEGTQINKDGYYTIGKTKLPISISPDKVGDGNSIITGEFSCITVDDAKYALKNNFVHHAENQVITADLLHDKMESLDVKAESQGATGYVNSGWTWHMDIQISFSEVQYLYKTLTYKDGVENELFKPINKQILVGNTVEKHDFDGSIEGTQDPVRPGYIFTGWKDNNGNVVDLTNGKYVMPEENLTLTAQWEVDENSRNYPYVIHYVYVDSGNQTILYSDKGNGYIGQIIDVPKRSFEGYTVKENNPTSLTVKEDGSAEVYVYYDINTYEVRWINDDERETILEHDTSVKYGEQPVYNGPNPEKVSDKEYIYEFVGWTPELKPVTENITYKATYSSIKRLYPYSVKYLYDGKSIDEPYLGAPKGGQAEYGSEVSINPNKAIVIDGNNYVLVSQNHIIKIEEYEDKNIIYVKYELDNNKDDIPDKYQRTVTFTAINGGFNGDVSNTEVRLIVTLRDSKGNLDEHGIYYLQKSDVPLTNAPQAGYATVVIKYDQFGPYEKEAKWYPLIAVLTDGVTTIQDNINYKFTYIEEELPGKSLGVRHFIENEKGEITQTPVPGGELIGPFGVSKINPFYEMTANTFQNYTFKVIPPMGYCFDRLEFRSRESHNGQEYTLLNVLNPEDVVPGYALDYSEVNHYEFAYIYSVDENNNQIPDKYEVTVKYEVENGLFNEVQFGSLNEAQTIVTQQYELAESVNGIWQVKEVVLDNIPIPTPDDGYDPMSGKWEYEPKKGTLITKDLDGVVYKYKYDSKIQLKALIKYVDEEQQDQPIDTQEVTINYGDDVVAKKYVKAFPNYVLIDDTQVAADVKENGQAVTILYAKDVLGGGLPNTGDDIPDKYQVTLTFKTVNGVFIENESPEVTKVVTLVDENGNFSENGTFTLLEHMLPKARPVGTYTGVGSWDHLLPNEPQSTVITKEGPFTFTIRFNQIMTSEITINTHYEGVENVVTSKATEKVGTKFTHDFADEVTYEDNHYVLESVNPGETITVDASAANNVIDAYYVLDNEGGKEPGEGDGTPDKYQAKVVFDVVNGHFNNSDENHRETYVTLFENDKWSENGVGYLSDEQVAYGSDVVANDGYVGPDWNPYVPSKYNEISKDGMEYVATFALPKYNVTINYVNEKSEPIAETKYFAINKEGVVEQVSPEVDGYALLDPNQSKVVVKGEGLTSDYVVTVVYGEDKKGTIDPETGENEGDGIADKYQVDVVFAAVNGVFIENGKTQVEKLITLADENGNFSDKGTFILSDYMLPKARPVGTYTGVGSWDHLLPNEPQPTVITKEGPFTFTIRFNQIMTSEITINTHYEGVENVVTSKATQEVGTEFTHDFADEATYKDNHYVLESVNPGETITVDASAGNNVIDAYYVLDNEGGKEPGEGDGTPDKYQVKVTYEAVNGTVSFAETFVTLYKDGVMTEDGTGYLTEEQIPTTKGFNGYSQQGEWAPETPVALETIISRNNHEFTITYSKDETHRKYYSYTVQHITVKDGVETLQEEYEETYSTWVGDVALEQLKVRPIEFREYEGYVYDEVMTGEIPSTVVVDGLVKIYYSYDVEGGKEPGEGDGTPDKYQVKVTYEAVNGEVSFAETFVTLYKDGVMAEDGTGYLTEEQIPTFGANIGYHFVKWNPEEPTVEVEITEDNVFTAYYEADAPVEPDHKDPVFQCPEGTVWNDETGMCDAIVVPVPVDPGNNPPVGPVNPGNFPADMTTPDDGDDQEAEIVETPINDDDNTGKGEVVDIEDQVTPEAGGVRKGHWALINLIATVGGALLALILLIGKHKKDVDDENDDSAQVVTSEMDEEDEEFVTRRRKWKFFSAVIAVVSVVIFFLTENMSLPMVWVDKYTLLMLALFLLNAVSLYMGRRWHEEDKDEEEQTA